MLCYVFCSILIRTIKTTFLLSVYREEMSTHVDRGEYRSKVPQYARTWYGAEQEIRYSTAPKKHYAVGN